MSITRAVAWVTALVAIFVSGCSTTSVVQQQPEQPPPRSASYDQTTQPIVPGNTPALPHKAINLTPLSTYTDDWSVDASEAVSFANAYTRLLIYSDVAADGNQGTTPLPYTERPWWLRALLGQEFSINLTAKVTVGSFETTVPLATIGHESNSDGEQWNRVIHHSKSNFPFFLVRADGSTSVPVVKFSVSGTKSYSSRGAAAAVQVALGVARATSQPVSVVTRLTEQSTRDKARAIDNAISKLFASGITEEHWTDRDLRLWRIGTGNQPNGVTVNFAIPSNEQDWNSEALYVGKWTITFDYPRPSIFSDWRVCPTNRLSRCATTRTDAELKIHKEIDASEVLNYVLWNGEHSLGTIRAFVSQQDWYISAQIALTTPTTAIPAANALCRKIANEIAGLGLNGFDAKVVVWAVTQGMPMPNGAPNFGNAADCKIAINPIEAARR